jgi:hypothetical protein
MQVAMPDVPDSQGRTTAVVPRPATVARKKPKAKPAAPKDPGVLAIEQTRDRHVRQANDAASWLASVLGAVQNASNQQAANFNAQIGVTQAALQSLGGFTGPQIQGVGGGMVGGILPTAATAAGQAAAIGVGGLRNELARAGLSDTTQSLISGAKRYAASLPSVYADKIAAYMEDLRAFQEKMRQFDIQQETTRYGVDARAATAEADRLARIGIAEMNEAGRNARAAASAAPKPPAPGGYRSRTPAAYATHLTTWADKVDTLLRKTRTVDGPNGQKIVEDVYTPEDVFDQAVKAGLRPSDALRLIWTHPTMVGFRDAQQGLSWLYKYLPKRNADAVALKIIGKKVRPFITGSDRLGS